MIIDQEKFDEIVLALLYYNSWTEKAGKFSEVRAWKSMDWDALSRLYEKDLIGDPKSKAKSVFMTEEGYTRAKELFERHFCEEEDPENAKK
jgi:hypothetical protein